jgi:RNA recognition motif-containing protein
MLSVHVCSGWPSQDQRNQTSDIQHPKSRTNMAAEDPTDDEGKEAPDEEGETKKQRRKRKRKRKAKDDGASKEENNKDDDHNVKEETDLAEIPAVDQRKTAEVDRTVYIEGIPFTAQPDDVKNFFLKEIDAKNLNLITDCRLPVWHDSGRLRGYGHIVFDTLEHYQAALKLSGKYLQSRYLKIEAAKNPITMARRRRPPNRPTRSCCTIYRTMPTKKTSRPSWQYTGRSLQVVCGSCVIRAPRRVRALVTWNTPNWRVPKRQRPPRRPSKSRVDIVDSITITAGCGVVSARPIENCGKKSTGARMKHRPKDDQDDDEDDYEDDAACTRKKG